MSNPWKPEIEGGNRVTRWFRALSSSDRRRAKRRPLPGLVAYYWDGAAPKPHGIQTISSTGMYLLTDQQWYRGTLVMMTLQRTENTDDGSERSIAVQARVVRSGTDGAGLAFVFSKGPNLQSNAADKKTFDKFLERFVLDRDAMKRGKK